MRCRARRASLAPGSKAGGLGRGGCNARLHPTGGNAPEPVDVGVTGGQITSIRPRGEISADGAAELDAEGSLLSPPLVDPHVHLDAVLTVGEPHYNESGTLIEGIL